MNRNYFIGFGVAVVLLGALAFAGWSLLEIYPKTKQLPPSREARINRYLALDRWLTDRGYRIRTEQSGDIYMISEAEENFIFIQSSLFEWNDEAAEYIFRWIEEGGELFLSLDNFRWDEYWEDEEPLPLLEKFGIEVITGYDGSAYDSGAPDYDDNISFEVDDDEKKLLLKDADGNIKLVQAKLGKGKLIVTGQPFFIQSRNIDRAPNARLAWAFFADGRINDSIAHNGNNDILFIRGATKISGLMGSLFRRGNLIVLVISVLVLIVVCFWLVIPRFGLVETDDERSGKSLRERFLAEGRFFKRHGVLGFYRDVYIKEIKRQVARKKGSVTDGEIFTLVAEHLKKSETRNNSRLSALICGGARIRYRDFSKIIIELKTILERV
jgi:hypothetical protein